jgi:hypothetical protein
MIFVQFFLRPQVKEHMSLKIGCNLGLTLTSIFPEQDGKDVASTIQFLVLIIITIAIPVHMI